MVFNFFFGLFASFDRLDVHSCGSACHLKHEPMWKHSGGKLMGPLPLTTTNEAQMSFDMVWFVSLLCFCIWLHSLLTRFEVVVVERQVRKINIQRQSWFSFSMLSSSKHQVLMARKIREKRFRSIRHVRKNIIRTYKPGGSYAMLRVYKQY